MRILWRGGILTHFGSLSRTLVILMTAQWLNSFPLGISLQTSKWVWGQDTSHRLKVCGTTKSIKCVLRLNNFAATQHLSFTLQMDQRCLFNTWFNRDQMLSSLVWEWQMKLWWVRLSKFTYEALVSRMVCCQVSMALVQFLRLSSVTNRKLPTTLSLRKLHQYSHFSLRIFSIGSVLARQQWRLRSTRRLRSLMWESTKSRWIWERLSLLSQQRWIMSQSTLRFYSLIR